MFGHMQALETRPVGLGDELQAFVELGRKRTVGRALEVIE
jgi:hypothetical protein